MDTTPLPTQDFDHNDNDQDFPEEFSESTQNDTNTYVVRITAHEKFTFDELYDHIHAEPEISQFVIGRELIPQEHYHLVITTDLSVSLVNLKDIIRAFIVPLWQDPETGKLPRGFGNKQYNAQSSLTLDSAVSYAIKLGEFRYGGFEEAYILARRADSYEKKKPSNFKMEYQQLVNDFQEDFSIDIKQFMVNFVNLKAKYSQQVVLHHAYANAISNDILRSNNAEDYVNNYLDKI